ncbi:putative transposase [Aminobacter aminovorans]|uniref:Transposase n=1 Tax=Aminobacter aminovorans TaxID=83263 RepID=A0A381IK28_AMIAI|nr:putative transposase [Aminobacter aminovorans]SUY28452.1 Putative transposase [Aminobacter aminovorans]
MTGRCLREDQPCRRPFVPRLSGASRLVALHEAGRLAFFGSLAHLAEQRAFVRHLSSVRKKPWVVYARAPFAGPEAVLAYLSRYTHRVAISNRRLIAFDEANVTFRYKDYRRDSAERQQVMTLAIDEFSHLSRWERGLLRKQARRSPVVQDVRARRDPVAT